MNDDLIITVDATIDQGIHEKVVHQAVLKMLRNEQNLGLHAIIV